MAQRRQAVKTIFQLVSREKKVSENAILKKFHCSRAVTRLMQLGLIHPDAKKVKGFYIMTSTGREAWEKWDLEPQRLEDIIETMYELKSRRDRGPVQVEMNLDPGDLVGNYKLEKSQNGQKWETVSGDTVQTEINQKIDFRIMPLPDSLEGFDASGTPPVYEDPARTALVNKIKKGLDMAERYEIGNVAEYLADFIRE